ncbi:unnamed protein product [Didymodactylos carnosus]|uniref:Uncharacterized protein n=1 Tax=Didymodactylos carnosus TaxID=1234261 RepID=A0A814Y4T4_9BILA|nr:unnamed protein product [Didymodactylos carnosus]CAF1224159.1 unnamed protein product [Didymodactylos carnosus]CAF3748058.1 unnamed protein product [Didymodactylos carnosus]CAF3987272.1 unnamed protein product [Didymodactylos carnosus]
MSSLNSTASNFWRKYLLGDGLKNGHQTAIGIRALVILSAIVLVWFGIALALIIHIKCKKNGLLSINNGLHDSTTSIPNKTKRSLIKTRVRRQISFHSINNLLPRLKRRLVCQRQTSHVSLKKKSFENYSKEKQKLSPRRATILFKTKKHSSLTDKHVKRTDTKNNHKVESDSSSGDEYTGKNHENKHFLNIEKNTTSSISDVLEKYTHDDEIIKSKTCFPTPVLRAHTSLPLNESTTTTTTFQKVNELSSSRKIPLLFYPIVKRPLNSNRSLTMKPVASARELRQRDDNWLCVINNINSEKNFDDRPLPLVMITDTASSHTNIVELDNFEDQHRLLSDDERCIMKELRASYRPRHST